ncbi:hypothetical protein V6Z11_A12G077800 [Gossypium hirsutum]
MPSESGDQSRRLSKVLNPGAPPPEQEQLPCPRCDSNNTKFCYYNNYNFSQPRHFCKSCRRYWTHGGTLRDIPVGGGTKKNAKRSRTNTHATATTHNNFPLPATRFCCQSRPTKEVLVLVESRKATGVVMETYVEVLPPC